MSDKQIMSQEAPKEVQKQKFNSVKRPEQNAKSPDESKKRLRKLRQKMTDNSEGKKANSPKNYPSVPRDTSKVLIGRRSAIGYVNLLNTIFA